MQEEITHIYKHLCFPKSLVNSYAGTKHNVYWECSEKMDEPENLLLYSQHALFNEETGNYDHAQLHYVKVVVCPFCGYEPGDKGQA